MVRKISGNEMKLKRDITSFEQVPLMCRLIIITGWKKEADEANKNVERKLILLKRRKTKIFRKKLK